MINEKDSVIVLILNKVKCIENVTYKDLVNTQLKLESTDLESLADKLSNFAFVLENDDEVYYTLLEDKILEFQNEFIQSCKKLCSERVNYNLELQMKVQNTIVPYYLGRFQINLSREISFLPLDLRLYVYLTLLENEASAYRQKEILNRIATTLYKADEQYYGEIAVFLSAWLKSKTNASLGFGGLPFSESMKIEQKTYISSNVAREKIMNAADLTADIAGREFWYGIKGHADLKAIHNIDVAKITLDLFCTYFEKAFAGVGEIQSLIMEMYKTKYTKNVEKWLKNQGLDGVNIVTRYEPLIQADEKMIFDSTKYIEEKQAEYSRLIIQNHKSYQYEFWNYSRPLVSEEKFVCENAIAQQDSVAYIKDLKNLLRKNRVVISSLDKYLIDLTTAMMRSKDWDLGTLNLTVGLLKDLGVLVWLRSPKQEEDIFNLLDTLDGVVRNDESISKVGEGWPIGIIVEDKKNPIKAIVYSTNLHHPFYIGHQYLRTSLSNLSDKEIEEFLAFGRNVQLSYWSRIEKRVGVDRSIKKVRSEFWKTLSSERSNFIGAE